MQHIPGDHCPAKTSPYQIQTTCRCKKHGLVPFGRHTRATQPFNTCHAAPNNPSLVSELLYPPEFSHQAAARSMPQPSNSAFCLFVIMHEPLNLSTHAMLRQTIQVWSQSFCTLPSSVTRLLQEACLSLLTRPSVLLSSCMSRSSFQHIPCCAKQSKFGLRAFVPSRVQSPGCCKKHASAF